MDPGIRTGSQQIHVCPRFDFSFSFINVVERFILSFTKITRWSWKPALIMIIVMLCASNSYSQTDSVPNKDHSGALSGNLNLFSFKRAPQYSMHAFNYLSDHRDGKSRFTWYDSPNKGMVLYDHYRHEYFPVNNYDYYGNMQDALIGGSIEYLFMLFDKKPK